MKKHSQLQAKTGEGLFRIAAMVALGPTENIQLMSILDSLGPRVCVLGPSNSGKSTLADAIGRKRGMPAIHLDQLFHQPFTDWRPRPEPEFLRLHEEAIEQEKWVIEGNYTRCVAPRLERATGFIVLDVATTSSLYRYFRRAWFECERRGGLEGGLDSVKWKMIHHIAVVTPPNRRRYIEMFEGGSIKGRLAQLSHAFLYRGHQARIHGFWKGGLIWLVDRLNSRLRPSIRLD